MLATLSFIAESPIYRDVKPFEIIGLSKEEVPDEQKTNIVYETQSAVSVTDIRSIEESPALDSNGFTWIRHTSKHLADPKPFNSANDDHGTVEAFLEETVAMMKETLRASSVYVYDWRYRKGGTIYEDRNLEANINNARYLTYAPIGYVHSDYSYQGGLDRLFLHLTESEQESFKEQGAKVRLINAWRPLKNVENAPLAMCDRRSVLPEDAIEVDKVLPNNLELETCIYHRPYHKWYFMSEQTPNDVLLFVQWEECEEPNNTTSVPHAALSGPEVTLGDKPRESLEVRMIVIS